MNSARNANQFSSLTERLATSGFRFTPQRQYVYGVLLAKRDHPTAEEVFMRAKKENPDISMATVYNCLDALVKCGLIRQVNLDRGASRFCPNMREHCHFHCDDCGHIFDLDLTPEAQRAVVEIPEGFKVSQFDVSVRGSCPNCATQKRRSPKAAGVAAR